MSSKAALKLTLAIIKPDVFAIPPILEQIKSEILANGFYVVRSKKLKLANTDAEEFYKEHKGKFFYNRLVTFMSSGPMLTCILAHENAVTRWRELMGPTKVYKTQYEAPDSIRGQHGLTDTRNATHGSDSFESMRREAGVFFKEFDMKKWYEEEEPLFREGRAKLDPDNFVHRLER